MKRGEYANSAQDVTFATLSLPADTYYLKISSKSMGVTGIEPTYHFTVIDTVGLVNYRTHIQSVGWQERVSDGVMAGTSGRGLRLEALDIALGNVDAAGSVQYRAHVQRQGWQDWVSDGDLSGTSGRGLRVEALEVRLAGPVAAKYDVWYRVHAQGFGWLGWAKNGASAGTAGYSYRLEALQIRLVPKGGATPGSTANAYRSK